jgi:hypothetical protein
MQWWRLTQIFGPVGSKTRTMSDPFLLVQSADPAHDTIHLPHRRRAGAICSRPIAALPRASKERHFAFEFHTKPGGHDWGEWDSQIPGCFESLDYFANLPANADPHDVGKRLAEHFVITPHQGNGTIFYGECATWYGALTIAQLTHDDRPPPEAHR